MHIFILKDYKRNVMPPRDGHRLWPIATGYVEVPIRYLLFTFIVWLGFDRQTFKGSKYTGWIKETCIKEQLEILEGVTIK